MEIGIVGKPNVGKSTFFKALTLVDVEIANYPFTTIQANVGVGYVRTECACKRFGVKCNPNNSYCLNQNRFVPVKLIDVAGLVPGAHKGKGLGNKFLDELIRADALIHVVDISGQTNELGEATTGHDPTIDISFLEDEIDLWFHEILKRNWGKIQGKVKYQKQNLVKELGDVLSGLGINEERIKQAAKSTNLTDLPSDDNLKDFAVELRKISKPMIIACNKIDLTTMYFDKLENYEAIPCCAEAELALRRAESSEVIEYSPGDSNFKIVASLDEKQAKGLDFIRTHILAKFGSTGLQKCLNTAVFKTLDQMVVYPVEDDNKLTDSKGNVLPDAHLMPRGSTALDLAYKIHTDIGDRFIGAIDCKTRRKVGKDHSLEDGDVIKILTGR